MERTSSRSQIRLGAPRRSVPPAGVRVLIAAKPVDFRKRMDGLAALAKETLAENPFSGTVLVFRAKRADRVKILRFWSGMAGWPRVDALMLVSTELQSADQQIRLALGTWHLPLYRSTLYPDHGAVLMY
jgi:transposase